jgi:DNA-binding transcriptional LysR family regulator
MKTDALQGLQTIKLVAEHGNFSAAAAALGVSPSAISQTVRQTEERLGVALFNRTTRSVSLTEAGSRLLEKIGPAIEEIVAVDEAADSSGSPSGLLRVNLPKMIYRHSVKPLVEGFMARYPDVSVELFFENMPMDIVSGGFDAGVRASEILASDMIAVKLFGPVRYLVVGAPRYLDEHGRPSHPRELTAHNCLCGRIGRSLYDHWEFESSEGGFQVRVKGSLILNDAELTLDAATEGAGLAYVTDEAVRERVRSGALEVVLEDFACSTEGFYLYYPARSNNQPKLRAFVEHILEHRQV